MGLYGSDEKLRAYFATDDASPYLVMRDNAGTTRVYAGGYQDGAIGIDVRERCQQSAVEGAVTETALAGRLARLERVARLDRAFFFGALRARARVGASACAG